MSNPIQCDKHPHPLFSGLLFAWRLRESPARSLSLDELDIKVPRKAIRTTEEPKIMRTEEQKPQLKEKGALMGAPSY
jgi:hypothetical protein